MKLLKKQSKKKIKIQKKERKINLTKIVRIISSILGYIIIYLSVGIYYTIKYILESFTNLSFDQILYTIQNSEGTSDDVLNGGISYVSRYIIILTVIIIVVNLFKWIFIKRKNYLSFKTKKNDYRIQLFPIRVCFINSLIVLVIMSYLSLNQLGIIEYYKNQHTSSDFIEMNYVDPDKVKLSFPKRKKNLIYIYLESIESSLFDVDNGGLKDTTRIPNLEEYATYYDSFSGTDKLGGAYMLYGTTWSIAGDIAQSAGIPLKLPSNRKNVTSGYDILLPGVISLGNILENNGYNNYFLLGSDSEFAGKDKFFAKHGNYSMFGHKEAINKGYIPKNYNVWWGYEDAKLFEYAKIQLNDISNSDKPFNLTIETSDTHFTDGYMDSTCDKSIFSDKYSNSYYCNDSKIAKFISWCQEQDWYSDTTIIMVGDHLSMQGNYYDDTDNDNRRIYNVIINSSDSTTNNHNRLFSSLDMFPTTLASLGVEIPGNKLGLGVNLYSNEKTILEKYGVEFVNDELSKNSDFYNEKFLGDTYQTILDANK